MLNKATKYALRAMVCLVSCNRDKPLGYKSIARQIEAPEQFTAKILQELVRSGLVRSTRGPGGGFVVHESNPDPTLIEVIRVFEGNSLFESCGFGLKHCSDTHPCPLHHEYARIRDQYKQMAEKNRLSDLADRISNGQAYLSHLFIKG